MPGLTFECTQGTHAACQDRGCYCPCHPWVKQMAPNPSSNANPATQKMCPKCQRRTPLSENFCREDGTPLVVGVGCKRCGFPLLGTDKHCANCGVTRTWEPPEPPVESTYAKQPPDIEIGQFKLVNGQLEIK